MRNTVQALKWITEIFNRHKIPFRIAGGLAARIYGSNRKLADIDIDIPDNRFSDILPIVKKYIIFGPAKIKNERWDLLLLTLKYQGQDIDISGADTMKIFDCHAKSWLPFNVDISKTETKEVFGLLVPVIKKEDLIFYKSKLSGEVDRLDVEAITK